ncbi:hypothetical protein A2U01_0051232, partial [Trifolium medium]|nr:hypothetical protein [Trifolium medium]
EVRDGKIVPLPGYQSDSDSEQKEESVHMEGVERQGESAHDDDPTQPGNEGEQINLSMEICRTNQGTDFGACVP